MIDPIDHKLKAIARLAVQFRESPNLIGYIQALLDEGDDLETAFQQILNERSIDTAIGVQLDILGEIVDQARHIQAGFFPAFFGFPGQPSGTGFNGAPFWNGTDPTTSDGDLTDDAYRLYIRAKAFTNSASSTHEDFVSVFKVLFGNDTRVTTLDVGNAHCDVLISHGFTPEEEQLLIHGKSNNTLPLAAGIQYRFLKTGGNGSVGFAGNPFATGFNNGGFLSEIGV